jgi:hypothetical protein
MIVWAAFPARRGAGAARFGAGFRWVDSEDMNKGLAALARYFNDREIVQ